jgi:hypothetical protein
MGLSIIPAEQPVTGISIKVPAGTGKDSVSAAYTLPAGVYTVQASGSSLGNVTYGANSFNPSSAANPLIQDLTTSASSITLSLNRSWTGSAGLGETNTDTNAVYYENGFFTIGGRNTSAQTFRGVWSTTGSSWNSFTFPNVNARIGKIIRNIANDTWIAVGSTNIYTSTNGTTWTTRAASGNQRNNVVQGTASSYVAVGGGGSLATSTDAVTWTTRTSGTNQNIVSLTYFNSTYILGSDEGFLATSTDGISWTARTSQFGSSAIRVLSIANNQVFATGDSAKLSSSTDGITWTTRTNPSSGNTYGLAWDGTLYGFPSSSSGFKTSTDFVTWTTRVVTNQGSGIAIGGQTAVMLADNTGTVAYSTAGLGGGTATTAYATINPTTPVTAS